MRHALSFIIGILIAILVITLLIAEKVIVNIPKEKEKLSFKDTYDYTMDVDSTGTYIYDGKRLVAHLKRDDKLALDSAINRDNQ